MYYFSNIAELDLCMKSLFSSKELSSVNYDTLSDDDKLIYLTKSEAYIDNFEEIPYKGVFTEEYQQHSFPRKLGTGYVVEKEDMRVRKAVCCVMFDYLKSDLLSRKDYIQAGLKSYSGVGVSESFIDIDDLKIISDDYVKYLGFCLFFGVL